MPDRIDGRNRVAPTSPPRPSYTVASGDTLYAIAKKVLGDGERWREIADLNKDRLPNPNVLRIGQVLRLPGKAEEENPVEPEKPVAPVQQPDRYEGEVDSKGNWSVKLANEFSQYVNKHVLELKNAGVEVDCSDLAAKLLIDFSKEKGIRNPIGVVAKEYIYTPENNGGLPNVNGPNVFISGINADNLAKEWTKDVNDADGNGVKGHDESGRVDIADLRPGDILFYDWDGDGEVNHTVNIVKVDKNDKSVTIAYGTYDNLNPDVQPVTWENLDLSPIQYLELKPGTEEYQKWLGPQNQIWGVRRYNFLPNQIENSPAKPIDPPAKKEAPIDPPAKKETKPEPRKNRRGGLLDVLKILLGG
ncbi:MAG TPA: LysM peptidoglycan-binding domain-containing protein [Chroococcales cyanobacterium]|jgi:LysM repeat protein